MALLIIAHFCTFVPGIHIRPIHVVPLNLLMGIGFAAFVLDMRREMLAEGQPSGRGIVGRWRENARQQNEFQHRIGLRFDSLLGVVTVLAIAYCLVTVTVLMLAMGKGQPDLDANGQPILENRGQKVRSLTWDEYHAINARIARLFTAAGMAFAIFAAAYFFNEKARLTTQATLVSPLIDDELDESETEKRA